MFCFHSQITIGVIPLQAFTATRLLSRGSYRSRKNNGERSVQLLAILGWIGLEFNFHLGQLHKELSYRISECIPVDLDNRLIACIFITGHRDLIIVIRTGKGVTVGWVSK